LSPNVSVELCALIACYQSFQPAPFKDENNEIPKPIQEQCTICAKQTSSVKIYSSLQQWSHPIVFNAATQHCPAPPILHFKLISKTASDYLDYS
jgi:hypothetical protein